MTCGRIFSRVALDEKHGWKLVLNEGLDESSRKRVGGISFLTLLLEHYVHKLRNLCLSLES